jgi:Family of unknown function (DUF5947)
MVRHHNPARGLAGLRRLATRPPAEERCELCAAVVREDHQHLVDSENRRLVCACDACAILFDHAGARRYRRVPRNVREVASLEISDALWNNLAIPIGLVFFFRSSVSNTILAVYPSPGGPTETSVEEDVWNELAALHRSLPALSPDVEALLVNRIRGAREYYIVPIDECYKLTGIIRRRWRGISGGDELWSQVRLFFDGLKQRARPEMSAGHA